MNEPTPLVSIIIPTYNRAHLIGETLDSVLAQTYQNWECIIVDDGSTDNTDEVLEAYVQKDKRFKYYHRPDEHLPGGNGARNYGFKRSQGEYIQWFDSDDLMVAEKIELKVKAMSENDVDFVVSQTKYFNKKGTYDYDYEECEVNFISYATTYISWFTPDILIKRKIALQVLFNEKLKAGQEYNFSCKLLLKTKKLKKINVFLTKRRDHDLSIGKMRQNNSIYYWITNFNLHWENLIEIESMVGKKSLPVVFEKYAMFKCIRSYFNAVNKIKLSKDFHQKIFSIYGVRGLNFYLALFSNKLFSKKEFFLNKLRCK
jgi:glycosyltransferase involved in cell wall biosynthesis